MNYCNLDYIPTELEYFVVSKIQKIINFEAEFGKGRTIDVVSQTEGDCSWTYANDENNSIDSVYGFSKSDFSTLRRFRKTRK